MITKLQSIDPETVSVEKETWSGGKTHGTPWKGKISLKGRLRTLEQEQKDYMGLGRSVMVLREGVQGRDS